MPKAALVSAAPAEQLDASGWALLIREAWQKSVSGIIETGSLIIKAKAALPHGGFEKMVAERLPFSTQTAQRLMRIAGDARLKAAHVRLLPPSW